MFRALIFACFLFCVHIQSTGQVLFTTHLGWIDWNARQPVGDHFQIGGDVGYRTAFSGFTYHLVYVRPTLVWTFHPRIQASFAVSDFYTQNPDEDINEFRLAEEVLGIWPQIQGWKVDHRVRFEHQYFSRGEQTVSHRGRYRLGIHSPSFSLFGLNAPFYSELTGEIFNQLGGAFIDIIGNQHRWEIVLGNQVNSRTKVGVYYLWQTIRSADEEGFVLRENIFRLRVLTRFGV